MKKLYLAALFAVLHIHAQSTKPYFAKNNFWAAQLAFSGKEISPSAYWLKQHAFGSKQRFRLGYMLRFTSYFANKVPYQTAPAQYTSGETGPQVLFVENIPQNIDTLSFYRAQVNSLNLGIQLEYQVYKRLSLAFNIDALGFSFGNDQSAYHKRNISTTNARPTDLNLLLVSDNDIGSLNSEFLVKYEVSQHFTLQAGFGFLFTEYTTDQAFKLGNRRFRNKSELFSLGFSYTPYKTF